MPSSQPVRMHDFEAEKRDKAWKYETVYAPTVLEWIVEHSSVRPLLLLFSHISYICRIVNKDQIETKHQY